MATERGTKMTQFEIIRSLLPEDGKNFPIGEGVNAICGKTLSKTNQWWKAVLLVKIKVGKNEKYQLRLYGWQKNKEGIYKVRQKFNISPSKYTGDLIDIFQTFTEESGKGHVLKNVYEKLLTRIDELERVKIHLEKQKSKVPELKRKIVEFKKLLENSDVNELKIHKFLKDNTWMFGTEYTKIVKSEKNMTIKSRTDFLLKRFDGYFDILELKSPKCKLFTGYRNKKTISKDLKNAISQIMIYLADARTYYLSIKDQSGIDIYFPKGIIVIGRRKKEDAELLKIHNEFLHNIEIWTYDDLLDIGKKTIETYKAKRK